MSSSDLRFPLLLRPSALQPEYSWRPAQAFSPLDRLFLLHSMDTKLVVHWDNFYVTSLTSATFRVAICWTQSKL